MNNEPDKKSSLSKQQYWDSLYNKNETIEEKSFPAPEDYNDFILWKKILKSYLPQSNQLKVVEIGSAPGSFLVKLHQAFGYEPFGIEYSASGVQMNKELFQKNNLPQENIIELNFLQDLPQQYQEYFDIVISRGFIEHFNNLDEIINKHNYLLKPNGYLLISIPNLAGFNKLLANFFNQDTLKIHNLDIMDQEKFASLFQNKDLKPLYCGYYGIFSFKLFNSSHPLKNLFLKICQFMQIPLNIAIPLLNLNIGCPNKNLSPYIIFIGHKIMSSK